MCEEKPPTVPVDQQDNGDKSRNFPVRGADPLQGLGSFHKTLPHNDFGEVDVDAIGDLVKATTLVDGGPLDCTDSQNPPGFAAIPRGFGCKTAQFTNPRAGLARDRLIDDPHSYSMPPAPTVQSDTTAAEMVELYWMARLRDIPFNEFEGHADVAAATSDINAAFEGVVDTAGGDPQKLRSGIDVPGKPAGGPAPSALFKPSSLFRLGLPGEEVGPLLSQFFVRPIGFGTQTIDPRQLPYRSGVDYLTDYGDWLHAQNSGKDRLDQSYSQANEDNADFYDPEPRYISTIRDMARFVNKDALHQAYFNAALLLLNGGVKWTDGNPYANDCRREAGFGVLGGPNLLALVSEVATRALKVIWYQKWQVHLRLRPEAYGGLVHLQHSKKRPYGLPKWLYETEAAKRVFGQQGGYLLPMAYSPGSPTHPSYGAGHATVAGACVTVLKAWFQLLETRKECLCGDEDKPKDHAECRCCKGQAVYRPIPFSRLLEAELPYGVKPQIRSWLTGSSDGVWQRFPLGRFEASELTIEGELNKLAQNVAMGRSMGGVHWRTDNTRSLVLGEAIAARVLCDITQDAVERPVFRFRTFARDASGEPKLVEIGAGQIKVNGVVQTEPVSAL
ncbi:MAG: hypothetical protein KDI48_04605 [Xanthomonadales bacterium]|nr:hypothetical protein [Xanthomonadales bacterium]